MAREYVGAGNLRRSQQSVKIGDDVGGGAGRRRGVASAPQAVGRVVAACAGELGHPILHFGPVRRQPALKDDRGAARARAVQEELAPADVEPARVGPIASMTGGASDTSKRKMRAGSPRSSWMRREPRSPAFVSIRATAWAVVGG